MASPHRMSVSAYARHRKVSRVAVYKAVSSGRITREPDGSIDPDRADRDWAANTAPSMRWGGDVALTEVDIARMFGS